MFIALVSFSNDTSIQNLENSMNNNQLIQQILVNNSLNTTQFVIWLQMEFGQLSCTLSFVY